MQHRLDIAYDDYLYETSWSLQSLDRTLLLAATSALRSDRVWFFCRSLPACCWPNTNLACDSVAGCMCATQRWTILTCSSAGSDPQSSSKEHVKCVGIVFRMTDDGVADSARAAIADPGSPALKMSCRGSSRVFSKVRKTGHFIPAWHSQFADRTSH
jgi:hypothetical protein